MVMDAIRGYAIVANESASDLLLSRYPSLMRKRGEQSLKPLPLENLRCSVVAGDGEGAIG